MANDHELESLARLLYTENRQDLTPEEAAGIVRTVYERQQLEGYPSDVQGVLNQPNQYHGFAAPANAEPRHLQNVAAGRAFGPSHPEYNKYMTLAQYGFQQAQQPQPAAPTHYFSGPPPGWAGSMKLTNIGRHTFGREKGRKQKGKGK